MCPGWNDEYLASMLKNVYDSRSFIKNAKAIKLDFHRSIIDPERLEKDFEYLKGSSMIDSDESCHGTHRPVNPKWKEHELKLGKEWAVWLDIICGNNLLTKFFFFSVKDMRENFKVLAFPGKPTL